MRLVRLQHSGGTSGETTSNYSVNFNPPFTVPEDSEVALQTLALKLAPDTIPITEETRRFAYTLVPPTSVDYQDYIDDHTITLDKRNYSPSELSEAVTQKLNRELFYVGVGLERSEQGAELFFDINPDALVPTFTIAARLENEFCGPPTIEVEVDATYGYAVSAGPPTFGALQRNGATVDSVDRWLTTKNVFCRGSGNVQVNDTYDYLLPGTWSSGGTVWTSDNPFVVADLGFADGQQFYTLEGNDPYTATITGGGANPIAITGLVGGPADGTADSVILQNGTGWVMGLIKTEYISDLTNIDITKIEYGVALPNRAMVDSVNTPFSGGIPSRYYAKGEASAWTVAQQAPSINKPTVSMILGKQRTGVVLRDRYAIHRAEFSTDGTTFEQSITTATAGNQSYTYDNYNLIIGICSTGGSLDNIRWTASKINNPVTTSSGYYERAAPDLLSRDDSLVVPHQYGLGFFFNGVSNRRFYLDFLNETTSELFGFGSVLQVRSNTIRSSSTLTVNIKGDGKMNFQYSFSENITAMINLPLDSYDGPEQKNALAFIPFGNLTTVNDTLTYAPPFPNFCGLRNRGQLEISTLNIRLLNDGRAEIQPQVAVSVSLLFRSA